MVSRRVSLKPIPVRSFDTIQSQFVMVYHCERHSMARVSCAAMLAGFIKSPAGFVCGDDALPVLPPPPCADGVCESLGA